jgi:hypothetical protein
MRVTMGRQASPSDLTDKQWELLDPLSPSAIAGWEATHL